MVRFALMLFTLLLAAGCGGSSGTGGVFTGTNGNNNNNNAGTGLVTFNFVKPQAALEVPQDTTELRFRFFDGSGGSGNIVQEDLRDFAAQITVDVTAEARSVVITAFSADGIPLAQAVTNIVVLVDGTSTVDFAGTSVQQVTIANLTVVPQTAAVLVDGTQQFAATANYTSGDVLPATGATWTSSGFASIDADTGLATGTSEGVSTITASLGGATGTATLTVSDTVAALTVDPQDATTIVGTDFDFNVTGVNAEGDPEPVDGVVWSITGNIATINAATGVVSPTAAGTVTVTATLGNASDSATLTVDPRPTASVTLSPSDADTPLVATGGFLDFTATALDTGGFNVPTNGAVFSVATNATNATATIDPVTGMLEATSEGDDPSGEGSVVVTVAFDGFSDSTTVIIRDEPGDLLALTSNPTAIVDTDAFDIGSFTSLVITGQFEEETRVVTNNDGLTFTSDDPTIATVTPLTGQVTGIRQGSTIIRAMIGTTSVAVNVYVNFAGGTGAGTGTNDTPTLNLQGISGDVARSASASAFATTTFNDDQGNLSTGTITIEASPATININVPGGADPIIGTAAGEGTDTVTVTLDSAATPAAIQTFLRGVTFDSSGAPVGPASITVTVDDGGNPASTNAVEVRDYNITGGASVNLTVNPANPEVAGVNYQTIADALTYIEGIDGLGGENSTITVVAGDYTGEGTLEISNDADFTGLTINGSNSAIAAGVTPGTRNPETDVQRLDVNSNGVTISGLRLVSGFNGFAMLLGATSSEVTLSNCVFAGGAATNDTAVVSSNIFTPPTDMSITNCTFAGWQFGVDLTANVGLTGLSITGCAFSAGDPNGNHVDLVNPAAATITGNGFTDAGIAHLYLSMDDGAPSVNATGNEFSGTGTIETENPLFIGNVNVDVSNSWWGQSTGPEMSQIDQGLNTTIITVPFSMTDIFPGFGPPAP
jgi:hypothetical protein